MFHGRTPKIVAKNQLQRIHGFIKMSSQTASRTQALSNM
jgi:hypothetical protein